MRSKIIESSPRFARGYINIDNKIQFKFKFLKKIEIINRFKDTPSGSCTLEDCLLRLVASESLPSGEYACERCKNEINYCFQFVVNLFLKNCFHYRS